MRVAYLPCMLLLLCLGVQGAAADSGVGERFDAHVYIGGFSMGLDAARNTDDQAMGLQAGIGWDIKPGWTLELQLMSVNLDTGLGQGTDFYHRGLGLDLQYRFGHRGELAPFVLLGLGLVDNDVAPDVQDDQTLFVNAGLGLVGLVPRVNWLRWRVEGRLQHDQFLEGMNDWKLGAGVEIPFSRALSSQADGQAREVIREVVREVKEPDADGDGVGDSFDRCPNSEAGYVVNGWGCVEQMGLVRREYINFEYDSSDLSEASLSTISSVLELLRSRPDVRVELAGHTDSVGSQGFNMQLSSSRVQAVYRELVKAGVDEQRVDMAAYGKTRPLDLRDSADSHARNRRVELLLWKSNASEEK